MSRFLQSLAAVETLPTLPEELRQLLDAVPDAIYLRSLSGQLIAGNAAATALIGLPEEQLIGHNLAEMAADQHFAEMMQQVNQILLRDGYHRHRVPWQNIRGEQMWLEATSKLLAPGGPVAVCVRDITAQVHAEQTQERLLAETHERERRLKIAAEHAQLINLLARSLFECQSPQAVIDETTRVLAQALGLDRCVFYEIDHAASEFIVAGEYRRPDVLSAHASYDLQTFAPFLEFVRESRFMFFDEVESDERLPALIRQPTERLGTHSLAYAGLIYRGELVGILSLAYVHETHRWSEEEQALINTVAEQMAAALAQARLHERARQTAQREALINRLINHIRQSLDLDEILSTALNELGTTLGVSRIYLRCPSLAGNLLTRFVYLREGVAPEPPIDFPIDNPYTHYFQAGHEFLAINDIGQLASRADLPAALREAEQDYACGADLQAHLIYALKTEHGLWGELCFHQTDRPRRWTEEELAIIRAVSEQLIIAVRQAELFELVCQEKRAWEASFNSLTQGIIVFDQTGRLVRCNPVAAAFEQAHPGDLIGRRCCDFTGIISDTCLVSQVLESGQATEFEAVTTAARRLQISISPIHEAADRLAGAVVVINDLTAQYAAEVERARLAGALAEQETLLRTIIDSQPECVKLLAADGTLLTMNPAGLAIIEAESLDQIRGECVYPLIDPAYRAAFQDLTERSFRGEAGRLEFELISLKGTRRRLATHSQPLRNQQNEIIAVLSLTRDITEQKRAEEALRRSEENFRLLIENASDIITILERDGTIRYESPSIERILGYQPEELVGQNAFAFVHPDDAPKVLQSFTEQVIHQGIAPTIEFRFRHKDGSWRWLEALGNNLLAHSAITGVIINSRDITERREMEAALRQSEERFHAFMANTPAIAFMKDEAGRYVYGNTLWTAQFNRPLEGLLGKTDYDLWPAAAADTFRQSDLAVLATGEAVELNEAAVALDGSVHHWLVLKFPIGDISGHSLLGGIALDITERKRAEEAVRQSERQFRALFDNALDLILIADDEGRYVDANPAACEVFGISREEMFQRQVFDFADPTRRAEVEQAWASFLRDGEQHGEFQLLRPDGLSRDLEFRAKANFLPGRHLSVLRDVTEQKHLREQLLQSEKLSAVGQLVAGVAHELNNPLTSVVGYSQLLMLDKPADDQDRQSLETVVSEALRARKIIQNLLTFARRSKPERRPVRLTEVVEKTLDLRKYDLRTRNIELVTELAPKLPEVAGDFQQLQQVVLNLITNAEQAMQDQAGFGTLTVRLAQSDDKIILTVQDTGPGISPENLNKIFEPFFTTKPVGKGTGLGLSICYGIIAEHGGQILVDSRLGEGTIFTIILPANSLATTAPASSEQQPVIAAKQVLVIDDESTIRHLIKAALVQQGHTVEIAVNGAEGLKLLEQRRYDLVLTDLRMPGMDGVTFYDYLRQQYPDLAQQVIFITGDTVSGETAEFLRQTGCASLAKPFAVSDLLKLFAEVAHKIRPAS